MSRTDDIQFFADLNARQRVTRQERHALIRERFASVERFDWERAFTEDVGLMGKLIRDILKFEVAEPGKPGPRIGVGLDEGVEALRRLTGDDYSLVPFSETLQQLRGERSIRALAAKLAISRSQVVRLLDGDAQPTPDEMQRTAAAFGKHPSYFLEWRTGVVTTAIVQRMAVAPEASIVAYRQLARRA